MDEAKDSQRTRSSLRSKARQMRHQDTWAERLVWRWLRDRRFSDYKIRRQHPYGPYILDFFCVEAGLDIEVDGSGHGQPEQRQRDQERDAFLEARGIRVLRIWNRRLRRERTEVREMLFRTLMELAPRPTPEYWQPGVQGGVRRDDAVSRSAGGGLGSGR